MENLVFWENKPSVERLGWLMTLIGWYDGSLLADVPPPGSKFHTLESATQIHRPRN